MPRVPQPPLAQPGDECVSDRSGAPHKIAHPDDDVELQQVLAWLQSSAVDQLMTGAVVEAIEYVLDGARTFRFDLDSPEVDSDERRTVGVKLQYRILEAFGLPKERPLDTTIVGIPVELKATIGGNWAIPREGQCEICLLTQVDSKNDRFRVFLMRTHRRWLNEGKNQDAKRTIRADARDTFASVVLDWTALPRNPLKDLTPEQLAGVFEPRVGIKRRVTALFGFLPEVVIPRVAIETVAAMAKDPLRRARQAKPDVFFSHELVVLMGTWTPQRELAARHGFDLSGDAWVAIRPETLGDDYEAAKAMMERTGN
ncbi:NaeI family type II restriction endonuclease [Nocardioides kribbensis]|uniref:NaeI family type II restriction endonuclease n=1 Tax=Nocardioides kribbensis TaxID=305517 RepID=A0ABV1NTI5_9ACTN